MRLVMHPYLDTIDFLKSTLNPAWLHADVYKRGYYVVVYPSDLAYAFIAGEINIELDTVITLEDLKVLVLIPTEEARDIYLTSLGAH